MSDDTAIMIRKMQRNDSITNDLTGFGDAARDKGSSARPNTSIRLLSMLELDSLYISNGYVKRLIDRHAEEATRAVWTVLDGGEEPDPTSVADEDLNVVSSFESTIKWSRLYGGACIFMVLDEEGDPDLSEPIDLSKVNSVLSLVVLDRYEIHQSSTVQDITSKSFRCTEQWTVNPVGAGYNRHRSTVHHSRIIYIPGDKLPPTLRNRNQGYDSSVINSAWDKIRNLETIEQAGAILAQELKYDVLKIDGLSDIETSDRADYMDNRLLEMMKSKSMLGMFIIGEGEELTCRAPNVSGFGDLHDRAKESFSSVADTPQTILFGTAPGGLNSDGDSSRKNFDKSIARYQASVLNDPLRKLYTVIYAAKDGPTNGEIPERIKIKFSSLEVLSATEQAAIEKTHTETDAIRVEWGFVTADHVSLSRYSKTGYSNGLLPFDPNEDGGVNVATLDKEMANMKEENARLSAENEALKSANNGEA